ncbi:polysaccharide pyruvyl transferase family protein [Alteromonas gracilis]|uniref:polysaccharide pyruvyl transferase family protein n=1 Tax=Alteromonas gracilis TaxID=1479524 RepID=UPI00321B5986
MKVAILTQPLGHNYGGLLQAYALQHAILKLGADVVTVDRRKLDVKLTISEQLKIWVNDTIRLAKGKIKNRPSIHKVRYVLTNLHSFKANHIQISPEITKQEELIEYFTQNPVDLLIVGSDQVWRPKYSPCIANYFFDFYSKIESSPKRISYAASFGVDTWEFNEQDTRKCRSLISGFDAVSVREDSAIELCKSYLNVDAVKVVDPTLLLESSDYKALMPKSDVLGASGRVLNYILDPAKEKQDIAKKIASLLSKESLTIKPDDYIKVKPKHIDKCIYPGVELWLQSFFFVIMW